MVCLGPRAASGENQSQRWHTVAFLHAIFNAPPLGEWTGGWRRPPNYSRCGRHFCPSTQAKGGKPPNFILLTQPVPKYGSSRLPSVGTRVLMSICGLGHYTPAETLRCGIMSRTYVCHPRGDPDRNYAVKIVRASRFPDIRSFEDSTRRECNIVGFLGRQGGHVRNCSLEDEISFR